MTDKRMASELTIEELDSRIRQIAAEMVSDQSKKSVEPLNREEILAGLRADTLRMYERARRYWRENNQPERAALSDEELDVQFWLFDNDDIPRLKEEQGTIEVQPSSLMLMLQALRADPEWKAEEDAVFAELEWDAILKQRRHANDIMQAELKQKIKQMNKMAIHLYSVRRAKQEDKP